MYWNVKILQPISNHALYVEIENGEKGIFDVTPFWDCGVFKELQNPDYFRQAMISFGAIAWPNGQDIAPETLLAHLQPA